MEVLFPKNPPVGYTDWHEAAADADALGRVKAWRMKGWYDVDVLVQVPQEYLDAKKSRPQPLPFAPPPPALRVLPGGTK